MNNSKNQLILYLNNHLLYNTVIKTVKPAVYIYENTV